MKIVSFWKKCELDDPPFVHPEDRETLDRYGRGVLKLGSLNLMTYVKNSRFCRERDRHFHLSLVPVPYAGCLAKADIFVLGLNPGFDAADYYAEYSVPDFRRQIEANLRQESLSAEFPFLYLDPQFCWHSGFAWWESKFRDIATILAYKRSLSYYESLSELSKRVAAIELIPYHSISFPYGIAMKRLLQSSRYARQFVCDMVIPRAVKGEAVVIVTRAVKDWALPRTRSKNIIVCPSPQNPSLSRNSKAGKAILLKLRIDRRITKTITRPGALRRA